MKKISLLAASVAFALMGCGGSDGGSNSDSDTTAKAQKPSIAVPTKGEFIDAKVIGLDYVSGSLNEQKTDATGGYTIDPSNPEVSFYLGGKETGLFIGSVSGRHITTPFEAAGTHQRAVNLARLLLTIGEGTSTLINSGQAELITAITLPTDFSAAADKLKKATLDNEVSLLAIATALDSSVTTLVTEENATTHMNASLANIKRGSAVNLSHWSRGSNWTFVQRSSSLRATAGTEGEVLSSVIHLDTTNEAATFDETSSMILTLNKDNLIIRAGSNDTSMSGKKAAEYLTCTIDNKGSYSIREIDDNDIPYCNDMEIPRVPTSSDGNITEYVADGSFSDYSKYNPNYQYSLTNPTTTQKTDENMSWSELAEMGGAFECMTASNCSEQSLSKFEIVIRDDNTDGYHGDEPKWQKEILSGSYDPITDVYIQSRRKIDVEDNNGKYENGRISESIVFLYPVEAPGQDRYVDFIGTWEARELCGSNVAIAKMTFTTTGLTMTGQECNGGSISEDLNETYAYKDLPKDLWWFGTNAAGVSKATLDQLNSTVRWNDSDNGIKINRFTYIPAGANWDKGLLIRDTLNLDGTKKSTITMKKVN
ncbi:MULTISPECIES: hypothetical protein [Aliivibrio]|uniref:Chromosome partitioning protein ParA n=1 Tax=Aliivibrio finisterrensis TaxID=511998 RepID=A0A4Q5KSJ9_9GAMM|nr:MULTISPECIES: hypothetical protein [Aliivibrio]MDD9179764.1 hypothetical protein [Aliivibrio sp. A6]RYU50440.1 hypothetical protein ERW57_12625 [Aliivibrio finisterrensis]RYU51184.1 hypothetical protein ERW56_13165 [Aliivibrio finisterrensis]RYU57006.1 hypothetical protein ERW50_13045 [Aliivibrio finisterrensis]RYU63578.1 hypothetical protein ERW53_13360 [Aliivibrio finisterrensis]